MENNPSRVLAYQVAKEISEDCLEQVSGGQADGMTQRSFNITGVQEADFNFDF